MLKSRFSVTTVLASAVLLAGCASNPKSIAPAYVSPLQYHAYNCEQLGAELQRLASQNALVSGQQKSTATKDNVSVGVGVVGTLIFWPAMFAFIGTAGGDQEHEVARLKGTLNAVESAAIQKQCTAVVNSVQEGKRVLFQEENAPKEQAESAKQTEQSGCKKYPEVPIFCNDIPNHINCAGACR